MSRRAYGDDGITLLELILATGLTVLVMGAVFSAVVVGTRNTKETQTKLTESHDAQLVQTYLPSDLQSATQVLVDKGAGSGCTGTPGPNVVTLGWHGADNGVDYSVSYREVAVANGPGPTDDENQLVRYACSGGGPAASLVVGHDLSDQQDLAAVCGSRVSVTITEKSGYKYTITGNSRVGLSGTTTPCPGTTTTTTAPTATTTTLQTPQARLLELDMDDTNRDGRMDRLDAFFNKPVGSSCTPAGWSVAGAAVSSGSISGNHVFVGLTGAAVDTIASNLAVSFTPSGSCSAIGFSGEHPINRAVPVVVNVSSEQPPGGVAGHMDPGDKLVITLSEPAAVSDTTAVTVAHGDPSDTIDISGITDQPPQPIGTGYVVGTVTWTGAIVTSQDSSGFHVSIELGSCTGNCDAIGSGSGDWNYRPNGNLHGSRGPFANPYSKPDPGPVF